MRSKLGIVCMLLGAMMVLGALGLFLSNREEARQAEIFARNVLPAVQEEAARAQEEAPSQPSELDQTPVAFLTQEDREMTEKVIDGHAYIGYLSIGELGLELPVMSGWSSRQLQISPCRYSGTVRGEDLVIMAHNYKAHFGYISRLQEGSLVRLTDMDGNVWDYRVVVTDILEAEAVEEMTAGEYDLTLFTCTANSTHRVAVRCDRADP